MTSIIDMFESHYPNKTDEYYVEKKGDEAWEWTGFKMFLLLNYK